MALQSEELNGRVSTRTPADPAMYPAWIQRLARRMMPLVIRPGKYIMIINVHDDGRVEMDTMQPTRVPEQLGNLRDIRK